MSSLVPEGLRLRKIKTKAESAKDGSQEDKDGLPSADLDIPEEPVSPTGHLFLHKSFYTVIICSLEFEQKMDLDTLRALFKDTLAKHPKFRSKVVVRKGFQFGVPAMRWVPVEVDITQHVFEGKLTEAEQAEPSTAIESFMGRLASFPPFDPSRPLWEVHLVHVPRPNSASTCVLRIQHALGDGTSLMSLMLACTRQTANPGLLPTLPGTAPAAAPDSNKSESKSPAARPQMVSGSSSETLESMAKTEGMHPGAKGAAPLKPGQAIGRAFTVALNTVVHISQFLAVVAALPDTRTVLKASKSLHQAPKRIIVTESISLADVTAIRKAVGATVNDVMMTVLALALERYIAVREQSQSGRKSSTLPKHPRVHATCLVNLRKAPGIRELSLMMQEGGGRRKGSKPAPWGNYMGTYLLPLPLSPSESSVSRSHLGLSDSGGARPAAGGRASHAVETLSVVKKMCDSKKLSLEAHWCYLNGEIIVALAGGTGAAILLGRLTAQTTLSVSNMLGPMEQVSLAGNPISAITPTVPPPNHALCCHFQSYNGQLKAVLYTCLENVPDPDVLAACFKESFAELKAEVLKTQAL